MKHPTFDYFIILQVFESVSILFTDVVGFTKICSGLQPMRVVEMLNNMYTRFDKLTGKHRVYKVCFNTFNTFY